MADPVVVLMRATAWTDGNPEDVRTRVFRAALDPDLIRNAISPVEAAKYFCSVATYITEVVSIEWFEILKHRYIWNHEKQQWNVRKV